MRDVRIAIAILYTMYQESEIQNFSGHQLSKETLGSTHGRFYRCGISIIHHFAVEVPKQNKGPNGIKLGLVYSTSTACIVVSHLIRECFKHSTESENELEILRKKSFFFSLYTCKSSKLYDCPAKVTGDQWQASCCVYPCHHAVKCLDRCSSYIIWRGRGFFEPGCVIHQFGVYIPPLSFHMSSWPCVCVYSAWRFDLKRTRASSSIENKIMEQSFFSLSPIISACLLHFWLKDKKNV